MVNTRTEELQASQEKILLQNKFLSEKQNEILTQNEELRQTQEELQTQRDYIEQKNQALEEINKNINLSIMAAKEIQQAILPSDDGLNQYFEDYYLLYKPRDIVSGDFYWAESIEGNLWLIVADCTGHGVPGAFMTLLGKNFLDKLIMQDNISSPAEVLKQLDTEIRVNLNQKERNGQRGMDLMILKINDYLSDYKVITYSGAKSAIYVYDNLEKNLIEHKGDRIAIGGFKAGEVQFNDYEIKTRKGNIIYLGTDGYQDQNNYARKSFSKRRFKDLILSIAEKELSEQKIMLEQRLNEYMKNTTQRDDILLMGIRV